MISFYMYSSHLECYCIVVGYVEMCITVWCSLSWGLFIMRSRHHEVSLSWGLSIMRSLHHEVSLSWGLSIMRSLHHEVSLSFTFKLVQWMQSVVVKEDYQCKVFISRFWPEKTPSILQTTIIISVVLGCLSQYLRCYQWWRRTTTSSTQWILWLNHFSSLPCYNVGLGLCFCMMCTNLAGVVSSMQWSKWKAPSLTTLVLWPSSCSWAWGLEGSWTTCLGMRPL